MAADALRQEDPKRRDHNVTIGASLEVPDASEPHNFMLS
jgi:hypothetical protein